VPAARPLAAQLLDIVDAYRDDVVPFVTSALRHIIEIQMGRSSS
jgi:hypothetical protein